MINRILSIAGRPGLFKLVNQGKNMLIVESLADGKRFPAYARDKVISLADVSMYTHDGDEPLSNVLESLKNVTKGEKVDIKTLEKEGKLRTFFAEVLPNFDDDRVYTNDIKKLFSWYNQLVAAGVTDFKNSEISEDEAAEKAEKADSEQVANS